MKLHKFKSKYEFSEIKEKSHLSPKKINYESMAKTKSDGFSKCCFVDLKTKKRCNLYLEMYPKYCHLHTILIDNLYIDVSSIQNSGNGLFSGPLGFKKDEIIGEYSYPWMEIKSNKLDVRNGKGKDVNTNYVLCLNKENKQSQNDVMCYDGLDKNSTIIRNANDAHNSKFRNNCYFEAIKGKNGKYKVYAVTSKSIRPFCEIFISYGDYYF